MAWVRRPGRMLLPAVLVGLLALQASLALALRPVDPPRRALGAPPEPAAMDALALGDRQFLFRALTLRLQHAGSLDGRVVAYARMDYPVLGRWFRALDRLDARSDLVPAMAAFLYGRPTDPADAAVVVDYLADHALRDPPDKWRWLAQAVHIARYRQEDPYRALALARTLRTLPDTDLPYWARQLEVFVLADLGERAAARAILTAILMSDPELPEHERRWIRWYVARHLDGSAPGDAPTDRTSETEPPAPAPRLEDRPSAEAPR